MSTENEVFNSTLTLDMHEGQGSLHSILTNALAVTKAYGAQTRLEMNRGYSIRIWPSSTLTDIKEKEELSLRIWNKDNEINDLKNTIKEMEELLQRQEVLINKK